MVLVDQFEGAFLLKALPAEQERANRLNWMRA